MNTPICDFVKNYIYQNNLRLHMPGHKGCSLLGFEQFDITEITGADSLYEADGIIKQSEENASLLFGANTFYSTEGSSHCIRAMLYLALQNSGGNRRIAVGRNAHKTFLTAAALLDLEVDTLYGDDSSYISLNISPEYLENYLSSANPLPFAVYLTSPDYLGNMLDIQNLSKVCHKFGVLLLVDNAHGAYLKFLKTPLHPIDLGADICCDSAHKTLPVLTGGAYLHISKNADIYFKNNAKSALAMFGSTSPSYLILQSLDKANEYLLSYPEKLNTFISKLDYFKKELINNNYTIIGNEPLKITLKTKPYGYFGYELAEFLEKNNVFTEFFDSDFLTMMFTPEIDNLNLEKLLKLFKSTVQKPPIKESFPKTPHTERKLTVREAAFCKREVVDIKNALGRISADQVVGCPPAIPIIMCGEIITKDVIKCFEYYGIKNCSVVKDSI